MAKTFGQIKSMTVHYIVEDNDGSSVIYIDGPFSDLEVALDFCAELAHTTNKKNLEVYSSEVFLK